MILLSGYGLYPFSGLDSLEINNLKSAKENVIFSTPNKSIDLLFMRRGGKIIKENIQQMTHQQQQYSSSEMIDYKYEHKISS